MKRATFVLVVICSAVSIGCGSGSSVQTKAPPGYAKGTPPAAVSPEIAITKLETPEDRATYLRQLGKDSKFQPQQHVDMLQKYASDSNQEVASVAQELLDRK